MATIIHPSGAHIPLSNLSLESLQEAVGGYIELITLSDGRHMYLNEEGKLDNLPINEEATKLAHIVLMHGDYIVGPVVICTPEEDFDA
jgi:hypothetical protein